MLLEIKNSAGVLGKQNLEVLQKGKVVRETGYHSNMILDNWFAAHTNPSSAIGFNASVSWQGCAVGTGATPVSAGQSFLATYLTGKNQADSVTTASLGVVGNILTIEITRVWTFAEGAVVGNVSETGTFCNVTAPNVTPLFTRALVLNASQEPTTIPIGLGEQLRYTHKTQIKLDLTRISYSNVPVTTGGTTTNHLLEFEFCNISTPSAFAEFLFIADMFKVANNRIKVEGVSSTLTFAANNGTPTVTNQTIATSTVIPTQGASVLQTHQDITLASTVGNVAGGIGGLLFGSSAATACRLAMKATPPLPKTSNNKLTFRMTYQYTRL